MRIRWLIATCALGCLLPNIASSQTFEGRNSAMGGVGVASSGYVSAPLANPALLMKHGENDSIGIILPTIGGTYTDEDDLLDGIDDFRDSVVTLEEAINNLTVTPQDRQNAIDRLLDLNGRSLEAAFGGNVVIAAPGSFFSYALVATNRTDATAVATIDPGDAALILGATSVADLDNLLSEGRALSAAVTEVGVSVAFGFELAGFGVAVGVTPKYQRVDTYNYAIDVENFDEDDYDDDVFMDDDTTFNADIGATVSLPQGLTFGAVVRNVAPEDFETVLTNGQSFDYTVSTVATIGAAWTHEMLTIAAEADLTPTERFGLDDESKYLRFGAELDTGWFALRGGYQHDADDGTADLITAGIGLSPFDILHLDIAGMLGEDDSYGGAVQLGVSF
ncbi:MAG: conjugal transfer protein TraF [Planctomycetota bacterium]